MARRKTAKTVEPVRMKTWAEAPCADLPSGYTNWRFAVCRDNMNAGIYGGENDTIDRLTRAGVLDMSMSVEQARAIIDSHNGDGDE